MILASLVDAVCADLATLPGVATCRPYAGELAEAKQSPLLVPALLAGVVEVKAEPADGSGRVSLRADLFTYVCVRAVGSATARGDLAWALAEAVLARVNLATWGLAIHPALPLGARPLWDFETLGLAVREVRWSHHLSLGVSAWDESGLPRPSEILVGHAPRVGDQDGTAADYWPLTPTPWEPTP